MRHVGRRRYSRLVAPACLLFAWGLAGTVHAHSTMSTTPAISIPSPQALAARWDQVHLRSLPPAPLVRHPDVEQHLNALKARAPDFFTLKVAGHSVEGRALYHVTLGSGPRRILLWSQMHGDEPTATTALLDLFEYLSTNREEPWVARLLSQLTLHAVPMLNPDGAERFQRRNAQGIDINRDALALQTPEARTLKSLRDALEPAVGFNLHNQGWRHGVGDTGRPASISVLAPAFDQARGDNPGRILAKKVCGVIRDAVETLAPGQVGRYDDTFEARAFGDNMTRWGTPTVLIETGAWTSLPPDEPLVRLNFVALATALDSLASGHAEQADLARYDSIPENDSSGIVHVLLKGIGMFGADGKPFTGDVGIGVSRAVRSKGRKLTLAHVGRIEELGDLRVLGAIETVQGAGLFVVPAAGKGTKPGDTYRLTQPARQALSLGQRADLMLLRPLETAGTFRIERVIRFDP
ncbi:M14 metallopeptidase family protein [Myxococcus stipitatus]|uniref:M14 family metallopeptidase n=1 Tax=Myxococcus stipitatus TaxID=83455 RepID=UPI0030CCFC90